MIPLSRVVYSLIAVCFLGLITGCHQEQAIGQIDTTNSSHATEQQTTQPMPDDQFMYQQNYIHPGLVEEFMNWSSDYRAPIIRAIDVDAGTGTNEYFADVELRNGRVFMPRDEGGYFAYEHLGKLDNEIHVLRTFQNGGGSGVFQSLVFISFERKDVYGKDGKTKVNHLVMNVDRVTTLGDRAEVSIDLSGNKVTITQGNMSDVVEY